uniref:Uncharacterized protein n=1 Tax=Arundo donax TaxID=35708 RepID=A0A0A9CDE3_ARUDO
MASALYTSSTLSIFCYCGTLISEKYYMQTLMV